MNRRIWPWMVIGITLFLITLAVVVGLATEIGDRNTSTPRVVVVTVSPAPAPTVTKRVKVPGPTRTVTVNKYPMCGGEIYNLPPDKALAAERAGGCVWRP